MMENPYGPPPASVTRDATMGTLRHVLTGLGGAAVAFSLMSAEEVTAAVDAIVGIAGGVSFLVGLAASIRDKWARR